jgi:origin recognition complex subunit 6
MKLTFFAPHRLKQSLNLPKIEPRPPCPPRIYNKLYAYLDSILLVRRSSRPQKPKSADSTPTKALPSRPTPTKAASLAPYKTTPGRAASSRKRDLQFADSTKEIAPWIHPTIRGLCKELEAPAAAPHILAGVTTILTLPSPSSSSDRDSQKEDKKDKKPALIAAVYFFVGTRLSGRETSGQEYVSQRKGVLSTLTKLREDQELGEKIRGKTKEGAEWEGWEKVGTKDVDGWLLEISTRGWLKLDWFENIIEGAGVGVKDDSGHVEDDAVSHPPMAGVGNENNNILQPGLGTMMQDRVDYLSEKKRAEYRIWKQGILKRIKEIEKGGDIMDTSDGYVRSTIAQPSM